MSNTKHSKEILSRELTIEGQKYTFMANRNVNSTIQTFMQNYAKANKSTKGMTIDTQMDYICCALLKTAQPNISLKEAREVRQFGLSDEYYGTKFDSFLNTLYSKCEVKGAKADELDFLEEEEMEEVGEF